MELSPRASTGRGVATQSGEGKRKRRPTTFDGFLTSDRQFDNLITGRLQTTGASGGGERANHDGEDDDDMVSDAIPEDLPPSSVPSDVQQPRRVRQGSAGRPSSMHQVKKVAGVQNAARKALEWLQTRDYTLLELAQALPKLSRARVELVMEALRAARLVSLIRKHAPDAAGRDHVEEVYRFDAGCSAEEALEIGGGKPVQLGTISKRIKNTEAELAALNERINILKEEAARPNPKPQHVLDLLRQFMKQHKSLEDDPFYSIAYKATSKAASEATEAVSKPVAGATASGAASSSAGEASTSAMNAAVMESGGGDAGTGKRWPASSSPPQPKPVSPATVPPPASSEASALTTPALP